MANAAENPHRSLAQHPGDWMRKALEYSGVSSKEMAEYLDVTPSTISRWVNYHQPPPRSMLRLWVLRTGVALSYLETGEIPSDNDPRASPDDNGTDPRATGLKHSTLAPVTGLFDRRERKAS